MKRSGPPKADPEKVRAWQQRSREKAAAKAKERAASEGPGGTLKRKAELARGQGLSKVGKGARKPEREARFRAAVPANQKLCFRCKGRATEHHHVVTQQLIRRYVRGLRIVDREEARKLTERLLRDERNLLATCQQCHLGGIENRTAPVTYSELPVGFWEFCGELGGEYTERARRSLASDGEVGG